MVSRSDELPNRSFQDIHFWKICDSILMVISLHFINSLLKICF